MIQKGCRHFILNGKTRNFARCLYSAHLLINYVLIMKRSIFGLNNISPLCHVLRYGEENTIYIYSILINCILN